MTTLGTEHIIKALQLPRLGRKTAFKLFKNLNFKLTCDIELFEYINENSVRFRLPEYSTDEIKKAIDNYNRINDLNQKNGIKSISYFDENYPELFKCIYDSPIVLNYLGDFKNLNNIPAVAIVGTREPSENGLKAAFRFGEIFGEGGFNVVSGLALGCDTGGHRGCLNKNGFTSAVLAHGLDHVYPKENKKLADEILENGGVLISEYHVGQKPLANYFVERDRLQAGLSNGIIVVETDLMGGTMHTVKFAAESDRRVAAFSHNKPELLNHPKTQGNQSLISEKKAIPLGTSDEINAYMKLLSDDYYTFSKESENKAELTKKHTDIPENGTQLSFF